MPKIPFLAAPVVLRSAGRVVTPLLVALLPKCGLCVAAYLHLFSLFGVSLVPVYGYLMPVLLALLAGNLLTMGLKARASGDFRMVALAVLGSIVLLLGRWVWLSQWLAYVGTALIAVATGWQLARYARQCGRSRLDPIPPSAPA